MTATAPALGPREVARILEALDRDEVATFLDLNGQAAAVAAALNRRFGCRLNAVWLDADGVPREPDGRDLAAYRGQLAEGGAEAADLVVHRSLDDLGPVDVLASCSGFGLNRDIRRLAALFDRVLVPDGRVIVDIAKGSGSYPFLNRYGSCNTLVEPTRDRPGRAVLSVAPRSVPAADWSVLARGLTGRDGFFSDLGEHSFLHVRRGRTLVVTFDNLDIAMTKREERRPWGYAFIEKKGWSMLGVMANGWTWFRDPAVPAEFQRLVRAGFFEAFERVVFYGASMGGYGAAAYSGAVPGSTVFAISPQSTLDRALVPWETRYRTAWARDFTGPWGDAADACKAAAAVHILYDPYVRLDALHAGRFVTANVVKWRCPLLGHRLGSSLQQMGVLQEIAGRAIDGELVEAEFFRLLRTRRGFARYQRELALLALDKGHRDLARRVCRYALDREENAVLRRLLVEIDGERSR